MNLRPRRRKRFSLVETNRLRNTISLDQTVEALNVSRGDAIRSRTVCTVLHSITRTSPQVDLLSGVTTSNIPSLVVVPYCHRGKLEIALVTGHDDLQSRDIEVVVVSGAASARHRSHRWLQRVLIRKLRGRLQRQFAVVNVEVAAASRLCKTSRDTLFVACCLAQRMGSLQHRIAHLSVKLELPSYFEMCRMRALLVTYTRSDVVYLFDTRRQRVLKIEKRLAPGGQRVHDVYIVRGRNLIRTYFSIARISFTTLTYSHYSRNTRTIFDSRRSNTNSQAFS